MIPKRPSFVLVQGQVYGPTAVAYRPGKSAHWYLMQAGGTTNMANKRAIFVIRANGTVVGNHSSFWVSGDASTSLAAGRHGCCAGESSGRSSDLENSLPECSGCEFDRHQRYSGSALLRSIPVTSSGLDLVHVVFWQVCHCRSGSPLAFGQRMRARCRRVAAAPDADNENKPDDPRASRHSSTQRHREQGR